jgi:hypothetical protein
MPLNEVYEEPVIPVTLWFNTSVMSAADDVATTANIASNESKNFLMRLDV